MISSIEEFFHEYSKVKGTSHKGESRSIATGVPYLPKLMDLRWRKFCQSFLYWKKTNESQRPWNNWKRWVPLVERPNFVPPFPYFAYMQHLEHIGGIFREQTARVLSQSYPHAPCDWNNWLQKLFQGFVLFRRHGNASIFQWNIFTGRPSVSVSNFRSARCVFGGFLGGSNFRLDWRIQVKYCLQQFHFDLGTLWAKVHFFTNASGPSIFYWHTFNFSCSVLPYPHEAATAESEGQWFGLSHSAKG